MLFISALGPLLALLTLGSAYKTLSDDTLKKLPSPGADFDIKNGAILAPILIPRVSGTPGNAAVLQHFVDFFRNTLPEWRLELHNSTSVTPTSGGKEIPFVNLIATRDPPGSNVGEVGRLAMVAHYDSKLTPTGFIGATDSAAPCAMILHMARTVDAALTKMWADGVDELEEAKGVQILLLDGEEAFHSWTDTDSLYGARYGPLSALQSREQTANRVTGRSLVTGKLPSTPPCPPTAPLSTRYHYSSSSICLAPADQQYHRTSKLRTGHTRKWLLLNIAFANWACSSLHQITPPRWPKGRTRSHARNLTF